MLSAVKTWQRYMVVGVLIGMTMQLIGIYGDVLAVRVIGAIVPLLALVLGLLVHRRQQHD